MMILMTPTGTSLPLHCTSNKEGNYTDTSGGGSEVVAPVFEWTDCNQSGEAEKRDEIDCLGR